MMLTIGTTVMVVEDLPRALAFWKEALGYVERRPASDNWVILDPPDGGAASLALDKRPVERHYPPRMHLDLYARDQKAEIERLVSLGARHIDWDGYPEGADYVVLEDTEGNRFCVVNAPGWFS